MDLKDIQLDNCDSVTLWRLYDCLIHEITSDLSEAYHQLSKNGIENELEIHKRLEIIIDKAIYELECRDDYFDIDKFVDMSYAKKIVLIKRRMTHSELCYIKECEKYKKLVDYIEWLLS